MDRPLVPFEAVVGLLAGFALTSAGSGLAVALDPSLRSVAALSREPLLWVLSLSPVLCGALGWLAGDLRATRERAHRAWQTGVEAEFARLSDQEWVTRAVVTSALDAVLVVGEDGIVSDANPTAERLFGLPAHALVGQAATSLLPDRQTILDGQTPSGLEQVVARHADGSTLRLELRTTTLTTPPVRILTLRENVLRTQLEASRSALEHQSGRAQQESLVRNHLLLDVDHGLREDLLRMLRAAEDLRAKGVAAEPVLVAAFDMLERMEQLLDLTLWDRAAGPPASQRVAVEDLFDRVNLILAPTARRWSRAVLVDLAPELGEVTTDDTLVAGAVRALVREAMLRGSGDVVIEVAREPGRDHDWLLVTVALGRTLPAAETEAIGAVLESRPATLPTGVDAALALGQRLAQHLGGRITLRPELQERGTTFGLVIPLGPPHRARASKVPLARSGPATTPS